ncbi:MAG: hypothetical protein OHK0012_17030 [Synechococcales cyanobacterium]
MGWIIDPQEQVVFAYAPRSPEAVCSARPDSGYARVGNRDPPYHCHVIELDAGQAGLGSAMQGVLVLSRPRTMTRIFNKGIVARPEGWVEE